MDLNFPASGWPLPKCLVKHDSYNKLLSYYGNITITS